MFTTLLLVNYATVFVFPFLTKKLKPPNSLSLAAKIYVLMFPES